MALLDQKKVRVFREREKLRQVTHWDLDYLSKDDVDALYATAPPSKASRIDAPGDHEPANTRTALLLMAAGAALLVVALLLGSRL